MAIDRVHFERYRAAYQYRRPIVHGEFGRLYNRLRAGLGKDIDVTVVDADVTNMPEHRFGYVEHFLAPPIVLEALGWKRRHSIFRYVAPVVTCGCRGYERRRFARVAYNRLFSDWEAQTCRGLFGLEDALRIRPRDECNAIVGARIAARMAKP